MTDKTRLLPFEDGDWDTLYAYMEPLWRHTYAFLPPEQVTLLLNRYFSPEGIHHYRDECGYRYFKVVDGGTVGVVVIRSDDDEVYLDKLYLREDARGQGYAAFVFGELAKYGKPIALNVNRRNENAVRCYRKNGFTVEREEEIVLENGMVNCDYRMVKR